VNAGKRGSYDVAVVGAGPMGSFLSTRLARSGLRVVMVEKEGEPGESKACAGGIHLDAARFAEIPAVAIERELRSFLLTNGRYRREWLFETPIYLMMEKRRLDGAMVHRAVEAGARLLLQSRVVEVRPAEQTLIYEAGPEKSPRQLRAQVFVFADGANTLARRLPGMPPESDAGRLRIAALAWELEAEEKEFSSLELILDPGLVALGYVWIFPKRDHVNVGLGRLLGMGGPPLPVLLHRFIDENPRLRGRKILRKKSGVIPAEVAPCLQKDNWLVIGDAAGMVNPLTGGGYVCGFRSAALAAEACIEAFRGGGFDARKLTRYPRRLRMTMHYATIVTGTLLVRGIREIHRLTGKSLYPPIMTLYLHGVHILMRMGAKPMQPRAG
jgi:digeranylgeranylglycerophospholipid reductase